MPRTTSNPDSRLLDLIGQFDALTVQLEASHTDADYASITGRQEPILEQICSIRAQNQAANVARARALVRFAPDLLEGDGDYLTSGDWAESMLGAILRDLVSHAT